jgi:flagellin-specific chaperone FliS
MRVQKMILGLYAGIDLEAGEVATNVARLLQFIMDQTVAKNFAAALRIANQLRDTYVAIQDEVEQLEEAGQLPRLDIGSGIQLSV